MRELPVQGEFSRWRRPTVAGRGFAAYLTLLMGGATWGDSPAVLKPSTRTEALMRLTHADPGVRRAAIQWLGVEADPSSVEFLMGSLGDEDPANRQEAAQSVLMVRGPQAVTLFVTLLGDPNPLRRIGAVQGLLRCGPLLDSVIPEVLAVVKDPNKQVRLELLHGLRRLSQPLQDQFRVNGLALAFLQDADSSVRLEAIGEMEEMTKTEFHQGRFWQIFHDLATKDPHPEVRAATLRVMTTILGEVNPILVYDFFAKDGAVRVRLAALTLLERSAMGVPWQSGTLVIPFLKDADPLIRRGVARVLRHLAPSYDTFRGALVNSLKDPDPAMRLEILEGLAEDRKPNLVTVLTLGMHDRESSIRLATLSLLADLGWRANRPAARAVIPQLFSPDLRFRRASAAVLGELGSSLAVPYLRLALFDNDPSVCQSAHQSLTLLDYWVALPNPDMEGEAVDPARLTEYWSRLIGRDPWEREPGAALLRKSGPAGLTYVLKAGELSNPEVREIALEQLGFVRSEAGLKLLFKAVDDPSPEIRKVVLWALAAYATPKSLETLTRGAQDRNEGVRAMAKFALQAAQTNVGAKPRPKGK